MSCCLNLTLCVVFYLFGAQTGVVAKVVRPWVAAQIEEFLGEVEETLVEFVCTQLESRSGYVYAW